MSVQVQRGFKPVLAMLIFIFTKVEDSQTEKCDTIFFESQNCQGRLGYVHQALNKLLLDKRESLLPHLGLHESGSSQ